VQVRRGEEREERERERKEEQPKLLAQLLHVLSRSSLFVILLNINKVPCPRPLFIMHMITSP
jgi:hypothetical protein